MKAREPVSINGVEFDAVIERQEQMSATVPQYPIENGVSISDNVALDAMELTMTLYLTATPITWASRHGTGEEHIDATCEKLRKQYASREPLEVVTSNRTYSSMVIKQMQFKKSEDIGMAMEIPITLTQVTTTSSEKVDIPAGLGKGGTTKKDTGRTGTGSASVTQLSGSSGSGSSGSSSSGSGSSGSGSSDPSILGAAVNAASKALGYENTTEMFTSFASGKANVRYGG